MNPVNAWKYILSVEAAVANQESLTAIGRGTWGGTKGEEAAQSREKTTSVRGKRGGDEAPMGEGEDPVAQNKRIRGGGKMKGLL